MIVAGLGSRKGVSADEVMTAIAAACEAHALTPPQLGLLATGEAKASEAAFADAALRLGIPLELVSDAALAAVADRTATRSPRSLAETGVPSLSEASALAAAGPTAALLGPRIVAGAVTCALASGGRP